MSSSAQAGILAPVPRAGRYLFFSQANAGEVGSALKRLGSLGLGRHAVVGVGSSVVQALGATVPGLRAFPTFKDAKVPVPATPFALWVWLRSAEGQDAGHLVSLTRQVERALAPAFRIESVVDGFKHGRGPNGHGRDLTGYEDGTENPVGEEARAAALVQGQGLGHDGASFVAVQQWVHDFAVFDAMGSQAQDHAIGRRLSDNEELDDAPKSAHVKRTAQESFAPEAFVLRRSMPWAAGVQAGLMFVAFGKSLDAFEAQMRRMAGAEDGVVDAMFTISRPVSGAYFWCPPVQDGHLDWRALGL